MSIAFQTPPKMPPDDAELVALTNETLERLRNERVVTIDHADFPDSKIAWKIATYRQSVLYRIVALAEALALNWNAQNVLGCYLTARSIIETAALLHDFAHELDLCMEQRDFERLDALVTSRHFATRDKDWVKAEPTTEAVNVLTLVDKMDKRVLGGQRRLYDIMSEYCHPNYLGHHAMFSRLDTKTDITTFTENKNIELHWSAFLGCMALIQYVESIFDRLDDSAKLLSV
jgi:hypothetical protein